MIFLHSFLNQSSRNKLDSPATDEYVLQHKAVLKRIIFQYFFSYQ